MRRKFLAAAAVAALAIAVLPSGGATAIVLAAMLYVATR